MKDRDLPIIPTAVFIATLVLSVFIYIVQTPAIHPTLVSQLVLGSDGTLWAVYRNRIIEVRVDGSKGNERQLSMSGHGVDSHAGNLLALKEGGWLINRGGQANDLWSDIKVFLRVAEPTVKKGDSSLLRCDAVLSHCEQWGDGILQFERVWSGVETSTGQFIINDVARHQLHLLSASGELLDTLTGFRFPNQTIEHKKSYWVTDTNRRQLSQVSVDKNTLVRSDNPIEIKQLQGVDDSHKLPGRITRVGDHWWMLLHNNNMASGGIYRLVAGDNTAKRFGREVTDAVDMLWHNKHLYLTDFASNAVWSIDPDTGVSKQLEITALDHAISEDRIRAGEEERYTWWTIAKVMLVGVIALVIAIRKSTPVPPGRHRSKAERIDFDLEVGLEGRVGKEKRWIERNGKAIRMMKWVPILLTMVFVPLPLIGYFLIAKEPELVRKLAADTEFMLLFWGMAVFALVAMVYLIPRTLRLVRTRLGVTGNSLLFSTKQGREIEIQPDEVFYSDSGLYSEYTGYIVVQNQKYVFFNRQSFETYALPLIKQGTRLTTLAMYWHRL